MGVQPLIALLKDVCYITVYPPHGASQMGRSGKGPKREWNQTRSRACPIGTSEGRPGGHWEWIQTRCPVCDSEEVKGRSDGHRVCCNCGRFFKEEVREAP